MTHDQEVYATTLDILGSEPYDDKFVQDIVDRQHASADPAFKKILEGRRKAVMGEDN